MPVNPSSGGSFRPPRRSTACDRFRLDLHACRSIENQRTWSQNVNPDKLLFPWKNGKPHSEPYLLQEILQPAGEAAGIGRVTWHQFRHIHSSQLHQLGTPLKIVQQQLGHSSMETTLNIYTHAIAGANREAIVDLERLLFPNVPKFESASSLSELVN